MKWLVVTEVDYDTKVPCTIEPQRTGPSMPTIKGLVLDWADKSTWPVEIDDSGVYLRPPKYYGTCDDDADLNTPGILEVLTESQWLARKHDEFYARKPFESWLWESESMTWNSPVPYPSDGLNYVWDESTVSWKHES